MYNTILNPVNNEMININSKLGNTLISKYMFFLDDHSKKKIISDFQIMNSYNKTKNESLMERIKKNLKSRNKKYLHMGGGETTSGGKIKSHLSYLHDENVTDKPRNSLFSYTKQDDDIKTNIEPESLIKRIEKSLKSKNDTHLHTGGAKDIIMLNKNDSTWFDMDPAPYGKSLNPKSEGAVMNHLSTLAEVLEDKTNSINETQFIKNKLIANKHRIKLEKKKREANNRLQNMYNNKTYQLYSNVDIKNTLRKLKQTRKNLKTNYFKNKNIKSSSYNSIELKKVDNNDNKWCSEKKTINNTNYYRWVRC